MAHLLVISGKTSFLKSTVPGSHGDVVSVGLGSTGLMGSCSQPVDADQTITAKVAATNKRETDFIGRRFL
jgi:hypothetical protein